MIFYWSPVSPEAVEAVYAFSRDTGLVCGFCASVSQVGPEPYTGLTDARFACMRRRLSDEYGVRAVAERDHLGRNGEDRGTWVGRDCRYGFEECMLHVHSLKRDEREIMSMASQYGMRFQIGPGEDDSVPTDYDSFFENIRCAQMNEIYWASFPTGCLIQGLSNRGVIDYEILETARRNLRDGIKIRAHNCDYLDRDTRLEIMRHFDGMNVAPQIGCWQSLFYLSRARVSGCDVSDWEIRCEADRARQERWGVDAPRAVQAIGHYHYDVIDERWRSEQYESCVRHLTQCMKEYACV